MFPDVPPQPIGGRFHLTPRIAIQGTFPMAFMNLHGGSGDWCHICGNRSDENVEVRWPENAEHSVSPLTNYARICRGCIMAALGVLDKGDASMSAKVELVAKSFGKRRPKWDEASMAHHFRCRARDLNAAAERLEAKVAAKLERELDDDEG
jgi:hypothetical protein